MMIVDETMKDQGNRPGVEINFYFESKTLPVLNLYARLRPPAHLNTLFLSRPGKTLWKDSSFMPCAIVFDCAMLCEYGQGRISRVQVG